MHNYFLNSGAKFASLNYPQQRLLVKRSLTKEQSRAVEGQEQTNSSVQDLQQEVQVLQQEVQVLQQEVQVLQKEVQVLQQEVPCQKSTL